MSLVVIGAGYVGLPLAIAFSKYFSVVCYDIDRSRIKNLKKGFDVNQQHSRKQIKNKNLIFTDNSNLLKNSKFYSPVNSGLFFVRMIYPVIAQGCIRLKKFL